MGSRKGNRPGGKQGFNSFAQQARLDPWLAHIGVPGANLLCGTEDWQLVGCWPETGKNPRDSITGLFPVLGVHQGLSEMAPRIFPRRGSPRGTRFGGETTRNFIKVAKQGFWVTGEFLRG